MSSRHEMLTMFGVTCLSVFASSKTAAVICSRSILESLLAILNHLIVQPVEVPLTGIAAAVFTALAGPGFASISAADAHELAAQPE